MRDPLLAVDLGQLGLSRARLQVDAHDSTVLDSEQRALRAELQRRRPSNRNQRLPRIESLHQHDPATQRCRRDRVAWPWIY